MIGVLSGRGVMPENVTGFQPTGNLKKSLIDWAYFDMLPRRSPTFFREEPLFRDLSPIDIAAISMKATTKATFRLGFDGVG